MYSMWTPGSTFASSDDLMLGSEEKHSLLPGEF